MVSSFYKYFPFIIFGIRTRGKKYAKQEICAGETYRDSYLR